MKKWLIAAYAIVVMNGCSLFSSNYGYQPFGKDEGTRKITTAIVEKERLRIETCVDNRFVDYFKKRFEEDSENARKKDEKYEDNLELAKQGDQQRAYLRLKSFLRSSFIPGAYSNFPYSSKDVFRVHKSPPRLINGRQYKCIESTLKPRVLEEVAGTSGYNPSDIVRDIASHIKALEEIYSK